MANEVLWSAIKSDSEREILLAEILGIQTDQYYILNHPALIDTGDVARSGSDTVKVREDNLNGAAALGSIAENGSWANAAYDVNALSVAVGQRYQQFEVSDLARMVSDGQLDLGRFAVNLMQAEALTWTNLIAAAVTTFTNTGVDLAADPTLEDFLVAVQAHELLYNDPRLLKISVMHPAQFHALQQDAAFLQAANVSAADPEVMAIAKMVGGVYKGRYYNTDIFTSFQVVTDGGKYQGGVFSRGALLTAYGTPVAESQTEGILLGRLLFERQRSTTGPRTQIRGSTFMGVDVAQQDAGVTFNSPA